MDTDIDDFSLCEENWEKLREVQEVGTHLNHIQQWFEADKTPDSDVLEAIHETAAAAGVLAARLVVLQIKLLNNL